MTDAGGRVADTPYGRIADGSVALPPSKSLTHRALILAAMAPEASMILGALESDDTRATKNALSASGATSFGPWNHLSLTGIGGPLLPGETPLECGDSGTTLRLLLGLCGGCPGQFVLNASPQLRQRPIAGLGNALEELGAVVSYLEEPGCAPLRVQGRSWSGGSVEVDGSLSSQFLSGLLLGAIVALDPVEIRARGLVSRPYAEMTVSLMRAFGVEIRNTGTDRWTVHPGLPRSIEYRIEPDASSASYFLAAAAVSGGVVRLDGIHRSMVQGDAAIVDLMEAFGATVEEYPGGITLRGNSLRGIDVRVSDTPDLVPTLGAVALFADGPSCFSGIGHLRHKESDRLSAVAEAVRRVGGAAEIEGDALRIVPTRHYRGAPLDPLGDHRMAMAFAVMGTRIAGIRVTDADCVSKSYPNFWKDWEGLFR